MIELSNELKQKVENLEKEKKELEQKIEIVESQKNSILKYRKYKIIFCMINVNLIEKDLIKMVMLYMDLIKEDLIKMG